MRSKWHLIWIVPIMLIGITARMVSDALYTIFESCCDLCGVQHWEA